MWPWVRHIEIAGRLECVLLLGMTWVRANFHVVLHVKKTRSGKKTLNVNA